MILQDLSFCLLRAIHLHQLELSTFNQMTVQFGPKSIIATIYATERPLSPLLSVQFRSDSFFVWTEMNLLFWIKYSYFNKVDDFPCNIFAIISNLIYTAIGIYRGCTVEINIWYNYEPLTVKSKNKIFNFSILELVQIKLDQTWMILNKSILDKFEQNSLESSTLYDWVKTFDRIVRSYRTILDKISGFNDAKQDCWIPPKPCSRWLNVVSVCLRLNKTESNWTSNKTMHNFGILK